MQAYGHGLVFGTTLLIFLFVLWLVRQRKIGEPMVDDIPDSAVSFLPFLSFYVQVCWTCRRTLPALSSFFSCCDRVDALDH